MSFAITITPLTTYCKRDVVNGVITTTQYRTNGSIRKRQIRYPNGCIVEYEQHRNGILKTIKGGYDNGGEHILAHGVDTGINKRGKNAGAFAFFKGEYLSFEKVRHTFNPDSLEDLMEVFVDETNWETMELILSYKKL